MNSHISNIHSSNAAYTTSYLKCPIHPQQLLQMICLTCSTNSLACPLCLDLQHRMHQVISLKKFLAHQVPKLYDNKPQLDDLLKYMRQFDQIFSQYIDKMRKQIGHEINQLEIYFTQKQQRLKQQLKFISGQFNVKHLNQNVQAAKIMIKNKNKIPSDQQFVVRLKSIANKMKDSVNDACLQIRKIIFKLKTTYWDSVNILIGSEDTTNFEYSSEFCHSLIQLKPNMKLGSQKQKITALNKEFDNIYHTCVVCPPLTSFNPQITFQILKSQHKCIWLGISTLQCIKKANFQNTYKIDGPNYWIWQAGGAGQEAELYSENKQPHSLIGWNFDQNDFITLRIQYTKHEKKILHFIKNYNQEQKCTVSVDASVGSYYACVSLGDEAETVGIINHRK